MWLVSLFSLAVFISLCVCSCAVLLDTCDLNWLMFSRLNKQYYPCFYLTFLLFQTNNPVLCDGIFLGRQYLSTHFRKGAHNRTKDSPAWWIKEFYWGGGRVTFRNMGEELLIGPEMTKTQPSMGVSSWKWNLKHTALPIGNSTGLFQEAQLVWAS